MELISVTLENYVRQFSSCFSFHIAYDFPLFSIQVFWPIVCRCENSCPQTTYVCYFPHSIYLLVIMPPVSPTNTLMSDFTTCHSCVRRVYCQNILFLCIFGYKLTILVLCLVTLCGCVGRLEEPTATIFRV